ncbi:MAG TPA: sialidase family protein [Anaerolineae bacterium]|nr:sialidase family protein [Anaerolineae bacterium]
MKPTSKAWRVTTVLILLALLAALVIPNVSAMPLDGVVQSPAQQAPEEKVGPEPSGIYDLRDADAATGEGIAGLNAANAFGASDSDGETTLTECPQAGLSHTDPQPLRDLDEDPVEHLSDLGNDRRVNPDYSCFPQNETSVDVNPKRPRNIVVGANDYRLGTGSSGFYASTDGGRSWYDGIIPFPSASPAQSRGEGFVISGGDPVIAFDRDGIVYYSMIAFFRGDDTNGVFVSRSTNGGFTWSRGCVPIGATDASAVCGGVGDVRQAGDGRVQYDPDNDLLLNGSVPFNDKEWMTAGPRPTGVNPVCFAPVTRTPTACNPDVVGVDRLYVTWTRFTAIDSQIYLSYSDDQARSWSPPQGISGSAPFCAFGATLNACDSNQFSVPTVNPRTGHLYVAFENFNTPDENQYLVVRSTDGGITFTGPFFVTPVFDLNFPRAGVSNRQDCTARGQQAGRIVYTNSCFRSNAGGNIVADKRGGAFADDLYLVMSDNRNGTVMSSNADVFLFKSTDGGSTWIGPTRVNNDNSQLTAGTDFAGDSGRDCLRPEGSIGYGGVIPPAIAAPCLGDFGADQWWPWVDIGEDGELNITFHDRRLDTNSTDHEWSGSRQRPGNYLVWQWGAQCRVRHANSTECLASGATVIPQPVAPVNPGVDPVPGQGSTYLGTLRNFKVSDVPSNFDYSFRAGIFAGDYENVAVEDGKAYATWTDARNGRSSRLQAGRNPICEQSDVFLGIFDALNGGSGGSAGNIQPFLVTPCPGAD